MTQEPVVRKLQSGIRVDYYEDDSVSIDLPFGASHPLDSEEREELIAALSEKPRPRWQTHGRVIRITPDRAYGSPEIFYRRGYEAKAWYDARGERHDVGSDWPWPSLPKGEVEILVEFELDTDKGE